MVCGSNTFEMLCPWCMLYVCLCVLVRACMSISHARSIAQIVCDHSPCPPAMKKLDLGSWHLAWGGIASVQLSFAVTFSEAMKVRCGCVCIRVVRTTLEPGWHSLPSAMVSELC